VKTDELISLLATGTEAVDARLPVRRFFVAVLAGMIVATLLTSAWLGVRPTLVRDFPVPMFWVKESFCASLGVAGLVAAFRVGRPGFHLGWVWAAAVATPVIVLWLLAAAALLVADPGSRSELIFGHTARVCSVRIALISIPLFVGVFAAMRGFAPTRLRLAGAAGGFAAGSVGALVYSLHCPELAAPFLGLWYVMGILIPTAVGAWVGAQALRW